MKAVKIALAVVNDLNYDQRMQKICTSLHNTGFMPTLIGREFTNSKPLKKRVFKQLRFQLKFNKGKLFYVFYNLRLLIHYIIRDYNILVANDLDTLPAAYFASKIKKIPFVYDAHEYFPELPEVVNRPFTKSIWSFVERRMAVKASKFYTINNEYQRIFKEKYDINFEIVRNIAVLEDKNFTGTKGEYILYQGAVNVGRGVEEMITAMQFINCRLVICGKGDNWNACVELVKELGLENKVEFKGFVEPEQLKQITIKALMGFTFFTDEGDSYYYSLANRFFDYLHNGVPQLCINFPEYKKINDEFNIAIMVDDLKIETIVNATNSLLNDDELHTTLHNNCLIAREALNWQNEEKVLVNIYNELVADSK